MKDKYYCGKYYCGKCKHIGIYTGRCAHSEKICKLYAEILKVDDNGVEKCVPCVCKTLETENVALRERLKKAPDNGKCFIKELHENGRVLYVISRYKVITSYICTELTPEAAIARLREFRGGKE